MSRIQGLSQEIQKSKGSMLSKLPKGPSVQELPREVNIIKSRAFPRSCISCIVKGPLLELMNPAL